MKSSLLILPLLSLVFASCVSRSSEAESAALELYHTYANHSPNLSVAYIGDFLSDGINYNALALHAEDSTQWQWLVNEFHLLFVDQLSIPQSDILCTPSSYIVTPLFLDHVNPDLDSAALLHIADSLANQLISHATGIHPDSLLSNDSDVIVLSVDSDAPPQIVQKMLPVALKHQNKGYVTSYNVEEQTVWLIFYNSLEEQVAIINKIVSSKSFTPAFSSN